MGYTAVAAVASVIGAGAAVISATKGTPKPIMQQAQRAPDADVFKKKAPGVIAPGGASTGIGSILSPSNSTGSNTLLGQ